MSPQIACPRRCIITLATLIFSTVFLEVYNLSVCCETSNSKLFFTHITFVPQTLMNAYHMLPNRRFIRKQVITFLTFISLSFMGYLDVTTETKFAISLVFANMAVKCDPIMLY